MSAVIGSYRARSRLGRLTWVSCYVYYILLPCLGMVERFTSVVRCTKNAYFYFVFTSVYYTGVCAGKEAVLAILFPTRVSASCGDLYLLYLCIFRSACYLYFTDQLAVRGLSAKLSEIFGSTFLAVLIF